MGNKTILIGSVIIDKKGDVMQQIVRYRDLRL